MQSTQSKENGIRVLFTEGATQVTLRQAIDAFLRNELSGLSEATKSWYRCSLYPFANQVGGDRLLSDLMEVDLLEWYEALNSRTHRYVGSVSRPEIEGGLSPDTRHAHVRAVKRLFKWLYEKGVLTANLAADLKLPRLPRGGRKGIKDDHVQSILEAARGNVRDYALLMFIEATGARRGGAANLLLSDLNLDSEDELIRRRVVVREKGDNERTVIMTPEALEALLAWLAERPLVPDEHVFLGRLPGKAWKPLSKTGITELVRRYKERLALTGKTSPHQWRHRWFRKLLNNGMGLKKASQLGGHSSVVVTDRFYSDFDIDELQESYDRAARGFGKAKKGDS
jgi:integrase/recombinase XerD